MSKHGFVNKFGQWAEEPCNEYCHGNHHALIAYATHAQNIPTFASRIERNNPNLRVYYVARAIEAPPYCPAPDEEPGDYVPLLVIFTDNGGW
jgi:hypothetical protein